MTARAILVVGSGGLVGAHVAGTLEVLGGWDVVRAIPRGELDVRSAEACNEAVHAFSDDASWDGVSAVRVAVNCAAYSDVDRAEREATRAASVNELGAYAMARACRRFGVPLLHLSTDYVYGQTGGEVVDEGAPGAPLGVYGRSKLEGDEHVLSESGRNVVLRTTSVYGPRGRNFASRLLERILKGEALKLDGTRAVSPTSGFALARAVAWLADRMAVPEPRAPGGVYHYRTWGETTWCDFARRLAEKVGRPRFSYGSLPAASVGYQAPRPRLRLGMRRLEEELGMGQPMPWQDAQDEWLEFERLHGDYSAELCPAKLVDA